MSSQTCRVSRSFWRVTSSWDWIGRYKRVSSVNKRISDDTWSGRSLIKAKNMKGPRTVSCGTPEETSDKLIFWQCMMYFCFVDNGGKRDGSVVWRCVVVLFFEDGPGHHMGRFPIMQDLNYCVTWCNVDWKSRMKTGANSVAPTCPSFSKYAGRPSGQGSKLILANSHFVGAFTKQRVLNYTTRMIILRPEFQL